MAELNLALLSAYVIAVLFLLLTPGPVVLLVTGTAARVGYTRAFLTLLGTNLASLVLITLAVLAIAGAVSLNKGYLALLGIGGSVFIGWGAVQSLREIWAQRPVQEGSKAVLAGGFMRGFFTGISNPKDILFFVSFFPQFIAISRDFTTSITTLCLLWIVFDFAVMAGYIVAIKRFLPVTQSRRFAACAALFLLLLAVCGVAWNLTGAKSLFM
ncbi:LysE family translocator [Enterobacteriaceae bacterium ENNIH3]|nr:LysE family translocator [Enterobacteriaceae bacterium ENNIH3]AUV08766.1 LysE family translocator [Enterobacteriaceae bacterium ENNIH2]MDU4241336.1 LysE family translocator [Bifidobacterium longum]PWF50350.1 LysE family translocator [[Kluyvera] intestini]